MVKTKLLYSFQLMRGIDLHSKIDGVSNYIIIMEAERRDERGKPYLLAMYSERPLIRSDTTQNTGRGFVASVTNRQTFGVLKKDASARLTEYNDYYIVFGKGEVQFKIEKDFLEVNLGHKFRSLDTGPHIDPSILTGDPTDKQPKFTAYEIYQITF
jgi:hypothetical protein